MLLEAWLESGACEETEVIEGIFFEDDLVCVRVCVMDIVFV